MKLLRLVELPGRSDQLWLDTIDGFGSYDRTWLRNKVFTGRVLVKDPKCIAARDIGLECWRDYLAVRVGIVGFLVALGLFVAQIFGTSVAMDGWTLAGVVVTALAFTGVGALVGNWIDYHTPHPPMLDGKVAVGTYRSQHTDLHVLWKRAIQAAIQADREGLEVYADNRLLEIHTGLRTLAAGRLTGLERKQMERWVCVAVQHLEDEVSRAMMGKVGIAKEISPLPQAPQLVEWTQDGTPRAEQELDHAEELR